LEAVARENAHARPEIDEAQVFSDEELRKPLRCMDPTCANLCEIPATGRPGAFCSSACRYRYHRRRTSLLGQIKLTEEALGKASKWDRPMLQRRRTALRFHLFRYPDIPTVTGEAQ
jgi:hypothetical protein